MAVLKILLNLSTTVIVLMNNSIRSNCFGQDQRPLLHNLLEKALTGNISNLFQLQSVYFHPAGKSPGDIKLLAHVTIANISHNDAPDSYCSEFTCDQISSSCYYGFNFTLSLYSKDTLQLSDVVGLDGHDTLTILDPAFSNLMGSLAIQQWLGFLYGGSRGSQIELDLQIQSDHELEHMPDYGEVCDSLSMLLVWVCEHAVYYLYNII